MRFATLIKALAFAVAASANSIVFKNLDGIAKTIYFTSNPNSVGMAPAQLRLAGHATATWTANGPWEGNYYSVNDGSPNVPGMLGEINWSSPSMIFYDVSAIVNANDNNGVKQIWGAAGDPVSGCADYSSPCGNCYNLWDDVQTKATVSGTRQLYCSVGKGASPVAAREVETPAKVVRAHARDMVAWARKALSV